MLDLRLELKKLDKEIEKAKKGLQLENESHPCFEETDLIKGQKERRSREMIRANDEIRLHIEKLNMRIQADLGGVIGSFGDEVSLFT